MSQSERYCIATQAGPDGFATLVYDHEHGNEIVALFARRSEAQAEADRLNAAAAVGVVWGGAGFQRENAVAAATEERDQ